MTFFKYNSHWKKSPAANCSTAFLSFTVSPVFLRVLQIALSIKQLRLCGAALHTVICILGVCRQNRINASSCFVLKRNAGCFVHRNKLAKAPCLCCALCFCGLPMPPIGLNAAVHNNLSPFMGDGRREGGKERKSGETDEGQEGKTGERREE